MSAKPDSAIPISSTPKQRYHPFHNSPQDTVIFRSSDSVFFRVSSYRLSQASPVFSDMFDSAHPSSEPIDVDVSSHVVDMFLNSINSSESILTAEGVGNIDDAFELLSISRMFECEVPKKRALLCLNGRYRRTPSFWLIVTTASKRNDVEVGRLLLSNMRENRLKGATWCYTEDMDPVWNSAIQAGVYGVDAVDYARDDPDSVWDLPAKSASIFPVGFGLPSASLIPDWIHNFDPYRDHKIQESEEDTDESSVASQEHSMDDEVHASKRRKVTEDDACSERSPGLDMAEEAKQTGSTSNLIYSE